MMFAIIIGNCVKMAFERPAIVPDSLEDRVLMYFDWAFTIIFGLEALSKIFAFSFNRYIRVVRADAFELAFEYAFEHL